MWYGVCVCVRSDGNGDGIHGIKRECMSYPLAMLERIFIEIEYTEQKPERLRIRSCKTHTRAEDQKFQNRITTAPLFNRFKIEYKMAQINSVSSFLHSLCYWGFESATTAARKKKNNSMLREEMKKYWAPTYVFCATVALTREWNEEKICE